MASRFYANGIKNLITGGIDVDTDTIKAAIIGPGYTPDFDAHDNYDDVSGNEVSGAGYTAGGLLVSSIAVTIDAANDRVYFDCADLSWPSSTITDGRYVAFYKDTGTPSTSRLIGLFDLGGNKSTDGDTFYVEIPATSSGAAFYFTY